MEGGPALQRGLREVQGQKLLGEDWGDRPRRSRARDRAGAVPLLPPRGPGPGRLPARHAPGLPGIDLASPRWSAGILTWRSGTGSSSIRSKPKMCRLRSNP